MIDEQAEGPSEIRLNSARNELRVTFAGGEVLVLSAEYLRVFSPSAEVQGHGPGERKLISGKESVTITDAELTGNYAVRLNFSDGHNSGIFTWVYLRDLAKQHDTLWPQYLQELKDKGLAR